MWPKVSATWYKICRLPEKEQFGHVGHCVGQVGQVVDAPVDEEDAIK